jgi:hypothetical protein
MDLPRNATCDPPLAPPSVSSREVA